MEDISNKFYLNAFTLQLQKDGHGFPIKGSKIILIFQYRIEEYTNGFPRTPYTKRIQLIKDKSSTTCYYIDIIDNQLHILKSDLSHPINSPLSCCYFFNADDVTFLQTAFAQAGINIETGFWKNLSKQVKIFEKSRKTYTDIYYTGKASSYRKFSCRFEVDCQEAIKKLPACCPKSEGEQLSEFSLEKIGFTYPKPRNRSKNFSRRK